MPARNGAPGPPRASRSLRRMTIRSWRCGPSRPTGLCGATPAREPTSSHSSDNAATSWEPISGVPHGAVINPSQYGPGLPLWPRRTATNAATPSRQGPRHLAARPEQPSAAVLENDPRERPRPWRGEKETAKDPATALVGRTPIRGTRRAPPRRGPRGSIACILSSPRAEVSSPTAEELSAVGDPDLAHLCTLPTHVANRSRRPAPFGRAALVHGRRSG